MLDLEGAAMNTATESAKNASRMLIQQAQYNLDVAFAQQAMSPEQHRVYQLQKEISSSLVHEKIVAIQDCFLQFKEAELLSEANQIYCNSCGKLSNAENTNKFKTLPKKMTMIFNRGKGIEFNVKIKHADYIDPWDILDLDPTNCQCFQWINVRANLLHAGPSGMAGHFYSAIRSGKDNKPRTYNDAIVDNRNEMKASDAQLSYVWLLSTIAGAYVLWAFVKMMIDIAYRSIKFFALELLSPIAIISYIDPSSSKKGLFSKWLKETWSTYLSLFVRIFVFAIATVLLRAFNLSDIASNSLVNKTGNTLIVKLFFILAAVAFFKNAPKFIDELFGTTMSKDSDTKFAKGLLGGLVGAGVSTAIGGISGAVVAGRTGNNIARGAWEGVKKGFTGGWKSGQAGGIKGLAGVVGAGTAGRDAAGKYFGVKTGAEARKAARTREQVAALSDEYEEYKKRSGYKDAIGNARDAASLATAIDRAATTIDDAFAQSEYGFATGSESAKNIKKLAVANARHKQDKSLMMERAKVFDAIRANSEAVKAGHITQQEADRLNLQSVLNYNKLAAQKDSEYVAQLDQQASGLATQLALETPAQLQTRVDTSANDLYREFTQLQGKANRTMIEQARMDLISQTIDVNLVERKIQLESMGPLSVDQQNEYNSIVSSGVVKSTASSDSLIDVLSKRSQRRDELRDSRSEVAKANAQYDKAKGAVDSWLETNAAGAEYYKGVKAGDKVQGR